MFTGRQENIERMVDAIQTHAAGSVFYTGVEKISERVIDAIRAVPRDDFVPDGMKRYAFDDSPLPIGAEQTISQPFIVALMCELLGLNSSSVVLDVGTGCGYHAAVLSFLCKRVYSIEIRPELAELGKGHLERYSNVVVGCRDGRIGWEEQSPFDGISVAAAADIVPPALLSQLNVRGRMVIPLKSGVTGSQGLTLIERKGGDSCDSREVLPVTFVPLV